MEMVLRINVYCLAILMSTGCCLNSPDINYIKYVSLISDVHAHYKTSSVFFTLAENNHRMQTLSQIHSLCRTFSRQAIPTLIVTFTDINERLIFYRKKIVRPLVVTVIKSATDIAEFNRNIQGRVKSYPIWLAIFYPNSDEPICEFCTRPVGNILQLRFDTTVIVVCCNNPEIKEWWSVQKNQTEIDPIGLWTENERLKVMRAGNGRNPRRSQVQGTLLRIVAVSSTSANKNTAGRISGFFGEVFNELQAVMNFTTTKIQETGTHGMYDDSTKTWSGAVGMLVRGEADLAVADLAVTLERLDVIDFTYPLITSQKRLFIKQPESHDVEWSAYCKAFSLGIWLIIIALIITTSLLLTVIRAKISSISLLSLGFDSYMSVWGIYCQQGLSEFPARTPLRVAYSSTFISALVVSAAYCASFISYLTLAPPSLPFTDVEGFLKDGSYKLIILQNNSFNDFLTTSNSRLGEKMMAMMKPWNKLPSHTREGWSQVCNERVAFFTNDLERSTARIGCQVAAVGSGRVDSLALGLPLGSQYTDVINHHIQRFRTNGLISRLEQKYAKHLFEQVKPSYDAVEFSGVVPLLSLLAGGIILSILVLVCEKIYFSRKKHRFYGRIIKSRYPKMQVRPNLNRRKNPPSKNLLLGTRLQNRNINTSFIGYYP